MPDCSNTISNIVLKSLHIYPSPASEVKHTENSDPPYSFLCFLLLFSSSLAKSLSDGEIATVRCHSPPNDMRYQSVSSEYLPLPNPKKPNPKLYREEEPQPQPVPNLSCPDQDHFTNPPSNPIGKRNGDVLLQWGHNKRSRGSRADSPCRNGGSTAKIQRRSVGGREKNSKQLAVAMPPPSGGGGYSRGANLRSCVSTFNKNTQERSNGHNQPQRSQTSPPHKMQKATTFPNGSSSLHADFTNLCSEQEAAPTGTKTSNMTVLEWPRIYLSLSRKEKEEDFFAMKGTKLPQRPKKRPKNVDKSLQYCFPGLWLSDLTKGRYEVREKKCVKKRNRGLKGMEIDSDSD